MSAVNCLRRVSWRFRSSTIEGHRQYKECGDQFARNFLKGLAKRIRG
ncbi:DUF1456 family protein [Desulfosporosinus sp. Sb-LF]|nr:DUF1456 family protein [Desulfosporosinus sp. Sb-LF]TGE34646.1 DUF1456 family protein [Desulfosporosinus sp. Sb-LF]